MRTVLFTLLALLSLPALAQDPPPSEQSVRELLSLMQSRNMINTAMAQMDAMMRPMMQQALGERRQLTEREQQIVDDAHARTQAVLREQLRWENFEPQMISVYQKTFTEKEVAGMKAFYRTPIGQSVIAKMPIVMQQNMRSMQAHMVDMLPKIRQIQTDMAAQLKAEREAQGPASAAQAPASGPATQ